MTGTIERERDFERDPLTADEERRLHEWLMQDPVHPPRPPEVPRQARLIIWFSQDGETDWKPLLPADVPEWLKDFTVMRHLVEGEIASRDGGKTGWYRAERVQPQAVAPAVR